MDETFRATMQKSGSKGGWTYVVRMVRPSTSGPKGSREGPWNGGRPTIPKFLMALGDGTHKLPVKAEIREKIGKREGDEVVIALTERLGPSSSAALACLPPLPLFRGVHSRRSHPESPE